MTLEPGFPRFKDPLPEVAPRTAQQAQGARNRAAGMRFQLKARKLLQALFGVLAARFRGQTGNEESWYGFPVRVECKYGLKNHPVVTLYEKARAQSDANHAIGDPRPFIFVCGTARSRVLVVVELEHDLPLVAASIVEAAS